MSINLHVVTVFDDAERATYLNASARRHEVPVFNLGNHHARQPGERAENSSRKIDLVKQVLLRAHDTDIVLFADSDGVIFNANVTEIVTRFLSLGADIVLPARRFSVSQNVPLGVIAQSDPFEVGPSSRAFIGYAGKLRRFFSTFSANSGDQEYMDQCYRSHFNFNSNVLLDRSATIFRCLTKPDIGASADHEGIALDMTHGGSPILISDISTNEDEKVIAGWCSTLGYNVPSIKFQTTGGSYDVVGPEMILADFLSPDQCQALISLAESHGEWKSMHGDRFPGQEVRLRALGVNIFEDLQSHFSSDLNSIIEKFWWPMRMRELRDAFIIKYSPDSQPSMACHTDASLVSGIVKLNSGYQGGDTWFPRQKFSTKYIPVGKILLWPGQVTHGHEGRAVTYGTKYSLVIWTSRTNSDFNF